VHCGLQGVVLARDGDAGVTDLPVLTDTQGPGFRLSNQIATLPRSRQIRPLHHEWSMRFCKSRWRPQRAREQLDPAWKGQRRGPGLRDTS
jgi:hypothetical protein